jgi:hypothetical protein
MPPRAKLGVDAATQVTANTTAKKRRMIAFLVLLCRSFATRHSHCKRLRFAEIATIGPVLRYFD